VAEGVGVKVGVAVGVPVGVTVFMVGEGGEGDVIVCVVTVAVCCVARF
jgi:hypothetical protein